MSRPKHCFRTTSKEAYDSFKEEYPKSTLNFTQFVAVIRTWNEKFAENLIETGEMGKLPHGTGRIQIVRYKRKSSMKTSKAGKKMIALSIDWKKTNEAKAQGLINSAGEPLIIYHTNAHTDGYKYIFQWLWKDSYLKCAYIWKFKMAREHSRRLAKLLLTCPEYRQKYMLQKQNGK